MTFEVILIEIKYLRIHNISVHINFYQNRFINESVRKNFLKISEGKTERRKDGKTERRKDGKTERRSFFCELQKNLRS